MQHLESKIHPNSHSELFAPESLLADGSRQDFFCYIKQLHIYVMLHKLSFIANDKLSKQPSIMIQVTSTKLKMQYTQVLKP
mmetsp:Transcript_26351/g.26745  ORF Transcript_26351/g.26745 Transcript_26351/m.26745 type:complete len:81 (-) Transcript_26351:803-1045(-)